MASPPEETPDAHTSPPSLPPDDPELHSVVTDFVDYTEYFPSDMIRSLTLIRNLDERYNNATQRVHEYALALGKPVGVLEAAELRKKMSYSLKQATIFREAACAEAERLAGSAERNSRRLSFIRRKLQMLPMPPSRDPTPVVSPQSTRRKEKDLMGIEKTPKLTLHLAEGSNKKMRHRRVLVPGEVLPPPSASDGAYTQTEDSSAAEDELGADEEIVIIERRGRKTGTIKIPKRKPEEKLPGRSYKSEKKLKIRMPGMGTNVHSQVAGISTSNALALLPKPPADAKPGSRHMPWFKLTEYEMAVLRKSMKKNAVWTPSETMIRRQLKETGRGPENYLKAKAEAEARGEELLDEDPMDPDKTVLGPGEIAATLPSDQSQALENRGMRLNVAKKKVIAARKEQEAAEAAEAAKVLATTEDIVPASSKKSSKRDKVGGKEKTPRPARAKKDNLKNAIKSIDDLGLGDLFTNSATPMQESITITLPGKRSKSSSKKRKRESESSASTAGPSAIKDTPGPKRLKIVAGTPSLAPKQGKNESKSPAKTQTITTTTTVPLGPAGASPSKKKEKEPKSPVDLRGLPIQPTAAGSRPRRVSNIVAESVETPVPSKEVKLDLRPRSRGSTIATAKKAASAEPPTSARSIRDARRTSLVEAQPPQPVNTNANRPTRANRRPAPGFVTTSSEDGKSKVSASRRKAAPKQGGKTSAGAAGGKENVVEEEEEAIDPDEPRYCICGDVSWGQMIACENGECEKEWFHLTCVDLKDPPSRRQMWYCPECREKLGVFANGDPLVPGRLEGRGGGGGRLSG